MTHGRWHISFTLPSGQRVTADFRDPIVRIMERATDSPQPSDLAAILAWYESNIQMITTCQRGECDHVVV